MPKLTKAEAARINSRKSRGPNTPQGRANSSIVSDIAAARWRLRRMWRYQTAILDLEVEKQAEEFEKRAKTRDEDSRDAIAFLAVTNLAVTNNSKGYDTTLRHDIHLTRAYRKAMDELRCLRSENIKKKNRVLQNEPKDLGLSPLNATKNVDDISTEPNEPTASQHPPL